jgi:hypothetical protein
LGIKPNDWIQRLQELKEKQGLVDGPAISDKKGRVLTSTIIDQGMHEVLEELYDKDKDFIPPSITSKEEIASSNHAFRSFCWSSETRTPNQRVSWDDIDLVNRWHQVKKAD